MIEKAQNPYALKGRNHSYFVYSFCVFEVLKEFFRDLPFKSNQVQNVSYLFSNLFVLSFIKVSEILFVCNYFSYHNIKLTN